MTGCAAPQGGSGAAGAGNGNSGAGSTAAEAEQTAAQNEEDAGGTGEKPALVVMGEEEDTFDRAVKNRSSKSKADPDAYMIRERTDADGNAGGTEPDENTENVKA